MSQQTAIQSYKKKCKRCQNDILMSNASGKWKALESDGTTAHTCNGTTNTNNIKPESRPAAFIQQKQSQQSQQIDVKNQGKTCQNDEVLMVVSEQLVKIARVLNEVSDVILKLKKQP